MIVRQVNKRSNVLASGLGAGSTPKERALLYTSLVHLFNVSDFGPCGGGRGLLNLPIMVWFGNDALPVL